MAKELAIKKLAIYSDSQLITNQASSEYMAKHPRMILYLDKVQELLKAFPTFTIQQVPEQRTRMQTHWQAWGQRWKPSSDAASRSNTSTD
ncbi:hypothetical protein L3X38_004472 [Prunus dulcis]|uniref:RNase H type-1 domain-containing protein n=1 Tax=Prunus dulcis TaxID=3755 RepID=A0AAD4ZP29_PRUDU|nr:hypothetical protein L3X38_004472 [Prunus dulcis]